MITEEDYLKITDLAHRKKFAQFFTPEKIADFMAHWVLDNPKKNKVILEPAFGLGVFSRSMLKMNSNINIEGYDIDDEIIGFAKDNFAESNVNIVLNNSNYLLSSWDKKFDGIICNPPYLKFHDYDNSKYVSILNKQLGIQLSGFTNLYALFLLKSISQMADGGRLAYIVPSEFLNSDYGVQVKKSLLKSGTLRHIIIVDFNKCAFDDALTTACILLCQKTDKAASHVNLITVDEIDKLNSALADRSNKLNIGLLQPEMKWRSFYSDRKSSKYNNLVPFSTFAKVSRGIATGANAYFTFNLAKKATYNIPPKALKPCICHSADVKKIIFTKDDFAELSSEGKNVYLFNGCADEADESVIDYIKLGIESGVDKKYLTASRNPWYTIENRLPSPIWVSVFNRRGLKFVRNLANVCNLTTFHCVYNIGEIDTDIIFAYLMTDMAKEILLDNSRQYGNGLIKLEPNDLNKGYMADLRLLNDGELHFIKAVYDKLYAKECLADALTRLLDKFFRLKYSSAGIGPLSYYWNKLAKIDVNEDSSKTRKKSKPNTIQLNIFDKI